MFYWLIRIMIDCLGHVCFLKTFQKLLVRHCRLLKRKITYMCHSEYCKPTGSLRELVRPLVVNNVIQKQSRSPLECRLFSTLISFGENTTIQQHNTNKALVVHHQQKWSLSILEFFRKCYVGNTELL